MYNEKKMGHTVPPSPYDSLNDENRKNRNFSIFKRHNFKFWKNTTSIKTSEFNKEISEKCSNRELYEKCR